jgi:peptidyl-prolyl cis-trans isomerase C
MFVVSCSIAHATEVSKDRVVALVNGVAITEDAVQREIEVELPKTLYHGNITEERKKAYREKAIENLIVRELFYQEAKATGIKVKRSKVNEVFESYKKQYGSKEKLKKALEGINLDIEGFKKEIEKNLIVNEFIRLNVEEKAVVSEKELKEYYERNIESFREPQKVRLREIFIGVPYDADYEAIRKKKDKAEEALKKVKAGSDFSIIAREYSEDPYAVKGGDIGYIHYGRLDPELEKVAFSLKPGDVSDIIEAKAGYFIIKVEESVPSRLLGFDEVKGRLKKTLEGKKRQELREELIKTLKSKATIDYRP